jgi:hypothetical protein
MHKTDSLMRRRQARLNVNRPYFLHLSGGGTCAIFSALESWRPRLNRFGNQAVVRVGEASTLGRAMPIDQNESAPRF